MAITSGTGNATIYYTTDGSTPTTASVVYAVPILVSQTATVQAFAAAPGFTNSAQTSATYTVDVAPGPPSGVVAAAIPLGYTVTTFAGSVTRPPYYADGVGTDARFANIDGIALDTAGNAYVSDGNGRIRKITPAAVVTTLAGGAYPFADGTGSAAGFNSPNDVAVDGLGNVYVADQVNNRIRKVTATGVVTTLAGSGDFAFADGTGTAASFAQPVGIAVNGSGDVYVGDLLNHRIRKVSPAGVVTTFAGSGFAAFADGIGAAASFHNPGGLVFDAAGNLYVADISNHRIRKVTPGGDVTTLAGSGAAAFADGAGSAASFNYPNAVALDTLGNVYVTDSSNHRIRRVTPAGVVTTIAGSGALAFADGPSATASFTYPGGIALDAAGIIYVADTGNGCIRRLALNHGELAVTWFAPTGPGSATITSYTASASAAGQATRTCTSGGSTSCTLVGLTTGAQYSVTVTATNPAGISPPSAVALGSAN